MVAHQKLGNAAVIPIKAEAAPGSAVAELSLSTEEDDALQMIFTAISSVPHETRQLVFIAFAAQYLPALANGLRAADANKQPIAVRNMIRMMATLQPNRNLYYRRFLRTNECIAGVPEVVASALISGVAYKTLVGRARVCLLLVHLLEECHPSLGDDRQSCLDAATRKALEELLHPIAHENSEGDFAELKTTAKFQHAALSDLDMHLKRVAFFADPESPMGASEPGTYFNSVRGLGENDGCEVCCVEEAAEGEVVDEPPEYSGLVPFGKMRQCSRCRTVKYCGRQCQMEDWRTGHKFRCFTPAF